MTIVLRYVIKWINGSFKVHNLKKEEEEEGIKEKEEKKNNYHVIQQFLVKCDRKVQYSAT